MSSKVVLDASALLCLLNDEPGAGRVVEVLTRSVMGTTNLAEVVSKLRERGLSLEEVREALGGLHLDVRPLSPSQAMIIGDLRPATKPLGLSVGDRACLALALDLDAELFTTDADLASADAGVGITDVRRSSE
ncbi:VapC toxin family PIN domain ribonuclease [Sphingomonas ginsenosidimutans]|uniref:VapC toxin family PIN domain ribonuclease n=1 Tax=Sphingomonas ginsenosidimutans TaxID=862134 RepID=A0A2A4I1L9_9SPHN|nr:type II toxin-antitoxin system VapC family toxin [Sphingomonas ginsenosidimutans]PCG09828.1 VapC toxin family PIN domain ribonuclease [Sphingomonas ginsenosidimutans]